MGPTTFHRVAQATILTSQSGQAKNQVGKNAWPPQLRTKSSYAAASAVSVNRHRFSEQVRLSDRVSSLVWCIRNNTTRCCIFYIENHNKKLLPLLLILTGYLKDCLGRII